MVYYFCFSARGFGRMDLGSPCYNCRFIVMPTRILPPRKHLMNLGQRRRHQHSCLAEDCYNRQGNTATTDRINSNVKCNHKYSDFLYYCKAALWQCPLLKAQYEYNPIELDLSFQHFFWFLSITEPHVPGTECVHPVSRKRNGKPQVVNPSHPHMSSGSTVNTCLSQGSLLEDLFDILMDDIREEDESDNNSDSSTSS